MTLNFSLSTKSVYFGIVNVWHVQIYFTLKDFRMDFSFTIILLHVLAAGFSPIKTNPVYLKHQYCRIYWLLALTLQIATNWMWLWLWETMVATKTCKNAKEKRLDCLFVTWWCTLNSYFTQIETKIWMLYSISAIKSYTGPLFSCLLANSSFFLSAFVLCCVFLPVTTTCTSLK